MLEPQPERNGYFVDPLRLGRPKGAGRFAELTPRDILPDRPRSIISRTVPDTPEDRQDVHVTRAELAAGRELGVGRPVRFVVPPLDVSVLRLAAVEPSFHARGTILLPEGAIPLLVALLESSPPHRVAVLGHAGHGSPASERRSAARARNVHALLQGPAAWADACSGARISELQHVLWWVDHALGYDCKPGPVDGGLGELTQAALRAFRSNYGDDGFGPPFTDLGAAPGRGDWLAFGSLVSYELGRRLGRSWRSCAADLAALPFAGSGHVGCGRRWIPASIRARDYDAKGGQRVEVWLLPEHCGPVLVGEDTPGESLLGEPGHRVITRRVTAAPCVHPPLPAEEPEEPTPPADEPDLAVLYAIYVAQAVAVHAMLRGSDPQRFDARVAARDAAWQDYLDAGGTEPRIHDLFPASDIYQQYLTLHAEIEAMDRLDDLDLYESLAEDREAVWDAYLDADGIREQLHDLHAALHLAFALELDPRGQHTAYNMALLAEAAYDDDVQSWFDSIAAARHTGLFRIAAREVVDLEVGTRFSLRGLYVPCARDYAPLEVLTTDAGTSVFVTHCEQHIIVAFRGTESFRVTRDDILTDSHIPHEDERTGYGKVHEGFQQALPDALLAQLFEVLDGHPGLPVFVTGHSLGGALALLFASQITTQRPGRELALYTFGQPRVGDDVFAKAYADALPRYFRHVHEADLVPRFPASDYTVWESLVGTLAGSAVLARPWIDVAIEAAPGDLVGFHLQTYLHFGREQLHRLDAEIIPYAPRIEPLDESRNTVFGSDLVDWMLAAHAAIRYASMLCGLLLRTEPPAHIPKAIWDVFKWSNSPMEVSDRVEIDVGFDGPQYLPPVLAEGQRPLSAWFEWRSENVARASKVTVMVNSGRSMIYSEEVTQSASTPGRYTWSWNGTDQQGVIDTARLRGGKLAIVVEVRFGFRYAVDSVALDVRRPTKPYWNVNWARPWWDSLELSRTYDAAFDVDVITRLAARTVEVHVACDFSQWLTGAADDLQLVLKGIEGFLGAYGLTEFSKIETAINAGKDYLGAIERDAILVGDAEFRALTGEIRQGIARHWQGPVGTGAGAYHVDLAVRESADRSIPFMLVVHGGSDHQRGSKLPYLPGVIFHQPEYWTANPKKEPTPQPPKGPENPQEPPAWGLQQLARVAAHEFGHAVLSAGCGLLYSVTHKGTSTIDQKRREDAPRYPASGEVDLMKYYQHPEEAEETNMTIAEKITRDALERHRASPEDRMVLISLAMLEFDT